MHLGFGLLLLLTSCAPFPSKRKNLDGLFVENGVIPYFLPQLPSWANRSSAGECLRKTQGRWFNMERLRRSFSLTYEEAVQFQVVFNRELQKKAATKGKTLSFQEEEKIFFQAYDTILAGLREFYPPDYKTIHLIWIDPLLRRGQRGERKLKHLMRSSRLMEGHPVWVSLCLSRKELKDSSRRLGGRSADTRLISYEFFGPYSETNQLLPRDTLNFKAFFPLDRKLFFHIPKKAPLPPAFQGDFILRPY